MILWPWVWPLPIIGPVFQRLEIPVKEYDSAKVGSNRGQIRRHRTGEEPYATLDVTWWDVYGAMAKTFVRKPTLAFFDNAVGALAYAIQFNRAFVRGEKMVLSDRFRARLRDFSTTYVSNRIGEAIGYLTMQRILGYRSIADFHDYVDAVQPGRAWTDGDSPDFIATGPDKPHAAAEFKGAIMTKTSNGGLRDKLRKGLKQGDTAAKHKALGIIRSYAFVAATAVDSISGKFPSFEGFADPETPGGNPRRERDLGDLVDRLAVADVFELAGYPEMRSRVVHPIDHRGSVTVNGIRKRIADVDYVFLAPSGGPDDPLLGHWWHDLMRQTARRSHPSTMVSLPPVFGIRDSILQRVGLPEPLWTEPAEHGGRSNATAFDGAVFSDGTAVMSVAGLSSWDSEPIKLHWGS